MTASPKAGWAYKKLNELGFVGRGKSRHRPRNDPSLYNGPYPFVQTADIMASEFYITQYSKTYSEIGLAQSKLWHKDTLCITIAGENTAESAILTFTACFPDSVVGFIADPEKSDVRFVKYYLDTIKRQIKSITRGATQDNLSLEKLLSFEILTPPLPSQRKIAAILSAYDDLIENNTRRIKILEGMAQLLYREWFVYFRFPGHEGVRMVKDVPEGWEVKTAGEVLEFHINGGWGEESFSDDFPVCAHVVRGTDIPAARHGDYTDCPVRYHKKSNFESRQLRDGDIVIEISGGSKGQPVGRSLLVNSRLLMAFDKQVVCASFCKLIRTNIDVLAPELLYLHLREIYLDGRIEKYQTQSTGITNFKSAYFLEHEQVVIPGQSLQEKFSELIRPVFDLIQSLGAKNSSLRRTRDLLLPRLVSGEVDVSELEIDKGMGTDK